MKCVRRTYTKPEAWQTVTAVSQRVTYKLEKTNWLKGLEIQTRKHLSLKQREQVSEYRRLKGIVLDAKNRLCPALSLSVPVKQCGWSLLTCYQTSSVCIKN